MVKSLIPKNVIPLRLIARIFGTLIALLVITQFVGAILRKGTINVNHPGSYILFIFFGLAQIGIFIAWRWERIGGLLIAFSIIVFDFLNIFWVQGPRMTSTILLLCFG